MKHLSIQFFSFFFILIITLFFEPVSAQMITGIWKGKINKKKVELKIIQNGDSLTGTSYYYESLTHYRRYSIRGYFDQNTNSAVWWDDQLLEERTGKSLMGSPGKIPYLSSADFNCPGSDKMYLEGSAAESDKPNVKKGPVDLEKTNLSQFSDEWDFVLDNYTTGANDPTIIDSISGITVNNINASTPDKSETETSISRPVNNRVENTVITEPEKINRQISTRPPSIEDKFIARQKVFTKEIPLVGDSIELHFYDNAEIDGDSISLFLNDKLLFAHIRLTGNAYIVKLPVADLKDNNELIMVAENMGSIPPNTSYMIAIVDDKRFTAQLASSENSSAMIRLVKPPKKL